MLGRWGVAATDVLRERRAEELPEILAGLEARGIGAIWFGENVGGEAFATAGVLLGRSSTLVVATGIANMVARAPAAMAAGSRILGDAYPGRFALGIGVSHAAIVEAYGAAPIASPLTQLTTYLDAMAATPPGAGEHPAPILVSALGPRMLELTGERGLGVHAWNVTPAHTATARAAVGPDALVAPRQAVMLCDDAATVRAAGRRHLSKYLVFANYRREWRRQGFDERDLDGEASDRLVDAMVAWGSPASILERLAEHHDAGADHVAIHPLPRPGTTAAEAVLELRGGAPGMKNDAAIEVLDALDGTAAAAAYERLGDLGDGLPVGEPSSSVLAEMVAATGRDADDVILPVPPLRGALTVRRLALCAALAGCEPRHLPVLVAACEALPEPDLNAFGFLTTTGSAAPMLLVNGPAARTLGFNSGGNCLGPGNRANATVGRCVSLVVRIVGGARIGFADMATLGQPAKYTCCFAENEEANPWSPFHVDRGFASGDSAVTVTGISGTVETFEADTGRTDDMLDAIAVVLAGSAPVLDLGKKRIGGGQPIVLLTPEWATQLAKVGLSKTDLQRALHERATRRCPDGEVLTVADTPDDVLVVVAGGVGVKQTVVPNWNGGARAVTRRIVLASS